MWRNKHLSTIAGRIFQSTDLITDQVILFADDGDELILDIPKTNIINPRGVVVVLHGLSGNAKMGYCCQLYRQLEEASFLSVGINARGAIRPNASGKTYHTGKIDDLDVIIRWVSENYHCPVYVVGFSLGGAIMMNYLGNIMPKYVSGAAIVSAPFDLNLSSKSLSKYPLYSRAISSRLIEQTLWKKDKLDYIDLDLLVKSPRLIRVFDEIVTIHIHGFESVDKYYDMWSPINFLKNINVPTLIVRSLDDPFLGTADLSLAQNVNSLVEFELTEYGGHVGFPKGPVTNIVWVAHNKVVDFFERL